MNRSMKSYRDLEVFKESKRLAIAIHQLTLTLPKFELFEEGSQIRRSSKSVTANIVEGYCRIRYKADFIKYLVWAQTECDETIVHLDFLFETKSYHHEQIYNTLKSDYILLSKKLNRFIQWVSLHLNDYTQ